MMIKLRNAHTAGLDALNPGEVGEFDDNLESVKTRMRLGQLVRVAPGTPTTAATLAGDAAAHPGHPGDPMHPTPLGHPTDPMHPVPDDVVNARVRAATDEMRATFDRAYQERGEELAAAHARVAELETAMGPTAPPDKRAARDRRPTTER